MTIRLGRILYAHLTAKKWTLRIPADGNRYRYLVVRPHLRRRWFMDRWSDPR